MERFQLFFSTFFLSFAAIALSMHNDDQIFPQLLNHEKIRPIIIGYLPELTENGHDAAPQVRLKAITALADGSFAAANNAVYVYTRPLFSTPLKPFYSSDYQIEALLELPKKKLAVSLSNYNSKTLKIDTVPRIDIVDMTKQGSVEACLKDNNHTSNAVCSISHMALLSDKRLICASCAGITAWNLLTKKAESLKVFKSCTAVQALVALPDGAIAYVCDTVIHIIDSKKNNALFSVPTKTGHCSGITRLPDGKLLSTTHSWSKGQTLAFTIFDNKTKKEQSLFVPDVKGEWPYGPGADKVLALDKDRILAFRGGLIKMWNIKDKNPKPLVIPVTLDAEDDRIDSVTMLQGGDLVIVDSKGKITIQPLSKKLVQQKSECSIQ